MRSALSGKATAVPTWNEQTSKTYACFSTTSADQSSIGQEPTTRAEGIALDLQYAKIVRRQVVLCIVSRATIRQLGRVGFGLVDDQHLCGRHQSNVLGSDSRVAHNLEFTLGK